MQCARTIPVAWLGSGSCQNRPSGWILMMKMICMQVGRYICMYVQFLRHAQFRETCLCGVYISRNRKIHGNFKCIFLTVQMCPTATLLNIPVFIMLIGLQVWSIEMRKKFLYCGSFTHGNCLNNLRKVEGKSLEANTVKNILHFLACCLK